MKKTLLILSALVMFLSHAPFCNAEGNLRYKPVVVQDGMNSAQPAMVLIVDQKKGDVWLWKADRGFNEKDSIQSSIQFQGNLEKFRNTKDF